MPKQLSKKSRYLFEAFNWSIKQLQLYGKSKRIKEKALKKKEEVDNFLFPKKAKYFYIAIDKKKKKSKLKFSKGMDPRIIATKQAGSKGGTTTAQRYPKEVRSKWTSKAGNTTLSRYGRDYFKHIRKKRKHYPKHRRRVLVKDEK